MLTLIVYNRLSQNQRTNSSVGPSWRNRNEGSRKRKFEIGKLVANVRTPYPKGKLYEDVYAFSEITPESLFMKMR